MQNPIRRPLSVALLLVAIATTFLDYWSYSRSFHDDPNIWAGTLAGRSEAPAQYRIGVLKTAEFLTRHSPLAMRHALTVLDFAALLLVAFVLRELLLRAGAFRSASPAAQWFGAAALVVLLQYSLLWLTWFQRPETLTVALLLALSLWLSTHRLPGPAVLTTAGLVLLGVMQGFTRADVGFTFHLGIAAAALLYREGERFALSRWAQFFTSVAAAGASAGAQIYIMRVLYPYASYGSTPRIQLLLNYTDHIRVVPFAMFLAPTVWVTVQVVRGRFRPSGPQAGLLAGAAFFLVLWCTLGKIDEVRIFLPFAFALAPLTVQAAMARIPEQTNVS